MILRSFYLAVGVTCLVFALVVSSALAQSPPTEKPGLILKVYGPGGPAPAMKEAAAIFGKKMGISVEVKAGPTPQWKEQAMKDADLIFSGSEYMMTDFVQRDLPDLVDTSTIRSLYLRASAILVRPGNPKKITGVADLARPGIRILVVQGAGQLGMWEDVAGRTGDIKRVNGVRSNIGSFPPNSAEAKKLWANDSSFDAWLIWTIWQKESPSAADLVPTEPESTIYRSCGIGLTKRSEHQAIGRQFAEFLESKDGREIFIKWGWTGR
ncbi:MAG: substrate-binding domain-containing protein [Syntrophobacteraceae bacterium]